MAFLATHQINLRRHLEPSDEHQAEASDRPLGPHDFGTSEAHGNHVSGVTPCRWAAVVPMPTGMCDSGWAIFIVVSGPPVSGKSTLAPALSRALGLPLVAKGTNADAVLPALGRPIRRERSGYDKFDRLWAFRWPRERSAACPVGTDLPHRGHMMHVHPAAAPDNLTQEWAAALEDAGVDIGDVALLWRPGRPRAAGLEAASWMPGTIIDPEFDDDHEFIEMLLWGNSHGIRHLRRVMVWTERTPEGLGGLLRHELEHTIQMAVDVELNRLHQRAYEVLSRMGATGKSYNAIPMEVDANRAAARFLRHRYGADRLHRLVLAGDTDAACFRPTMDPDPTDSLVPRMKAFILRVMRDDDFVHQLEVAPRPE